MAAAVTHTSTGTDVLPVVLCRVCYTPVRTARSRAARLGEGCRRKQRARWRRRYQQLPLLPLAAAAGRTDPARAQHQRALIELDEITAALVERTEQLEQAVHDITKPPDPKQPHRYERQAEPVADWRGDDVTPCRVCQRPRRHSIHRRARTPRAPRPDPRRELVDQAGRERDRAVLGERDDD